MDVASSPTSMAAITINWHVDSFVRFHVGTVVVYKVVIGYTREQLSR